MAQRQSGLRRSLAVLARRYGVGGRAAVTGVCVTVMLVAAAWGLHASLAPQELTLQRADASGYGERMDAGAARGGDAWADGEDAAVQADAAGQAAAPPVVHIDGAVARPGVYELEGENPRINDAVACAGGLLPQADTSTVNLASPVADGMKVHIPAEGEQPSATAGDGAAGGSAQAGQAAQAPSGLVNINTADAAQLQSLPGVGEATAASIMEDRERSGPFTSPEDLMRVSGIGEKKFAKLQGLICV